MNYNKVMAILEDADVQKGVAAHELTFIKAVCDPSLKLIDARKALSVYMEKQAALNLESLFYLLDHSQTLFSYALALSRKGWHRRYKNKKHFCSGSIEDILALQMRLLKENIRTLFAYAVNSNIELLPEALSALKEKAAAEAANGQPLTVNRGMSYAAIYDYQLNRLDRMCLAR